MNRAPDVEWIPLGREACGMSNRKGESQGAVAPQSSVVRITSYDYCRNANQVHRVESKKCSYFNGCLNVMLY